MARFVVVVSVIAVTAGCSGVDDTVVVESGDITTPPVSTPEPSTNVSSTVPAVASSTAPSTSTGPDGGGKGDVVDRIVTRSADAVGDGDPPVDFGTATVRITAADGTVCDVCMWLADTSTRQQTGLMGVSDLGGPVGMVFAYDAPTTSNFFMFRTVTPLSIAWFDESGAFLSSTDMDPCLDETSSRCQRFNTTGPYTLAIEMFRDDAGAAQLDLIGIGPGATAEIVHAVPPGVPPVVASPCAETA